MTSYTLSGMTYWAVAGNKVISIDYSYDGGLVPIKIPLTSSENNLGVNVLGKKMEITINGEFHGSISEITNFVGEVRTWSDKDLVDGLAGTKTFTGPFHVWVVKPMTFTYSFDLSCQQKISYQLVLFRAWV